MERVIEKRIVIHARPETVYRALTESAPLGRWLADSADSNPVVGGSLFISRGAGDTLDGARAQFTIMVPNKMIRIRWIEKTKAGGSHKVSGDHECAFKIMENPEGVVVTMSDEESPAPSDPERLKREQTWDETLVALKSLCEGPDAPRPAAAAAAPAGGAGSRPSRLAPKAAARKPAARARSRPATKPKKAKRAKTKVARKPKRGAAKKRARAVGRNPAKKKPARSARARGKKPAARGAKKR